MIRRLRAGSWGDLAYDAFILVAAGGVFLALMGWLPA